MEVRLLLPGTLKLQKQSEADRREHHQLPARCRQVWD